jgi:enterochelin esterase-like enzyme
MQLRSAEDLGGMQLLIGAGTRDLGGILRSTRALDRHLSEHHVPHRHLEYRGGHNYRGWGRVFPVALCKHLLRERCVLPAGGPYTLVEVE